MTFTLPAATANSSVTRDDYRQLRDLMNQGRPLVLEGRTIRSATFIEMLNPWRKKCTDDITRLFTEIVAAHQTSNPRENRSNWLMQAAGLWREQAGKEGVARTFSEAFKYMRVGLQPSSENREMVDWLYAHHQHHLIAFFGHQFQQGRAELPFETADGRTEWRPFKDVKDLFKPHPVYHMDGEFVGYHLGQRGFVAGAAWPNDVRPQDPEALERYAEWKPFKKSEHQRWGNQTVFEMRFWMTEESPQLRDNHFYAHLLMKDGWKYSAGEYRPKNYDEHKHPEGFSFSRGAKTYKVRYEIPDDSTYQWQAPPLTQKFRFEFPDEEAQASLERMKQLRIKDQSWYRGPTTICEQIYPRVFGLQFDFTMSFWGLISSHIQHHYTHKIATLFPAPLQAVGNACNTAVRTAREHIPEGVSKVLGKASGIFLAPIENLIAVVIGGRQIDDAVQAFDHPPEPAVTSLFGKRQLASHPFEAYRQIHDACSAYETLVREGRVVPPGGDKAAWLETDIHKRVHPYALLQSLTVQTACAV